jgi:hypothetical protein
MATIETAIERPYANKDHPFQDASIAFAVDVSWSTEVPTLRANKDFIARVSKPLSARSPLNSRILPLEWSGSPRSELTLTEVS